MPEDRANAAAVFQLRQSVRSLAFDQPPGHLQGFAALLRYLVRLRRDATIDDDVFAELVRYSSAMFIEAELNEAVGRALGRKDRKGQLFSDLAR